MRIRAYELAGVIAIFAWAAWGPVPRGYRPDRPDHWPRYVPRPAWLQWRTPSAQV